MGLRCKRCGSGEHTRNGFMRGKRRYRCRTCGLNFTDTPPRGLPLGVKLTAVPLHLSGLSMNRTARLLGVSTPGVMAWIERFAGTYARKPEPAGRALVIELDENGALPQRKSDKLWVWKARDRASGRLVDGELGGRDEATRARPIERPRRWGARLCCADEWAAYAEPIPVGRLYAGKDQTHGIGRDHARQRHRLARFRRRSIVVSRSVRTVDAGIALFAAFGGDDKLQDLLSMLA